jgi:hypothetical protein
MRRGQPGASGLGPQAAINGILQERRSLKALHNHGERFSIADEVNLDIAIPSRGQDLCAVTVNQGWNPNQGQQKVRRAQSLGHAASIWPNRLILTGVATHNETL